MPSRCTAGSASSATALIGSQQRTAARRASDAHRALAHRATRRHSAPPSRASPRSPASSRRSARARANASSARARAQSSPDVGAAAAHRRRCMLRFHARVAEREPCIGIVGRELRGLRERSGGRLDRAGSAQRMREAKSAEARPSRALRDCRARAPATRESARLRGARRSRRQPEVAQELAQIVREHVGPLAVARVQRAGVPAGRTGRRPPSDRPCSVLGVAPGCFW